MTKQALFSELLGGIGVLLIVAAVFMGGVAHASSTTPPHCTDGGAVASGAPPAAAICGAANCTDPTGPGGCKLSCGGDECDSASSYPCKCQTKAVPVAGGFVCSCTDK